MDYNWRTVMNSLTVKENNWTTVKTNSWTQIKKNDWTTIKKIFGQQLIRII